MKSESQGRNTANPFNTIRVNGSAILNTLKAQLHIDKFIFFPNQGNSLLTQCWGNFIQKDTFSIGIGTSACIWKIKGYVRTPLVTHARIFSYRIDMKNYI